MKYLKKFERHVVNEKVTIDLSGPDGNALALHGYARSLGRQLDLDYKSIQNDMMSGDYNHLLKVFKQHFGQVVDLVNGNEDYEEEYESVKESRSVRDSLIPEQIQWIRDEVLHLDDLDEAMRELQEVIVKTDDGGVCGMYWSKFDDSNVEWEQSTEEERMEHVISYLELEKTYDDLADED